MLIPALGIVGGLVILASGAEALVHGASSLARRLGVSPLVVGLTVVSIGTSLPELVVSVGAALQGSGGIALGNVVGSNIANLALILGVAALVHPMTVKAKVVRLDGPILVGVSLLFAGMVWDGTLGRWDGLILVVGILAYVVYNVRSAPDEPPAVRSEFEEGTPGPYALATDLGLVAAGLVGLVAGAQLLVQGATTIAALFGAPPVVVGLTVVAVGTSLPELATSVAAARRGQGDIAVGNAVGSSIFNLLGILGVTVLVQPLSTATLGWVDIGIMVAMSVLVLPLLRTHHTLDRREGGALVLCYGLYMGSVVMGTSLVLP